MIWKLQNAKAQFSKLVENALKSGPQFVTKRGAKAVVVISTNSYEKLVSPKPSLKDFLINCPKMESNFEVKRKKDYPKNINL